MAEFFNWLSTNPPATTTIIVAFAILVIFSTLIYTIAFFQGRSISFWPPKIGQKPRSEVERKEDSQEKLTNQDHSETKKLKPISEKDIQDWKARASLLEVPIPDAAPFGEIKLSSKPIGALVFTDGPSKGLCIILSSETDSITLGRSSKANVKMKDAAISREHIRLSLDRSTDNSPLFHIVDLKSANGTLINQKRIKPFQTTPIENGDIIRVGESRIEFYIYKVKPKEFS